MANDLGEKERVFIYSDIYCEDAEKLKLLNMITTKFQFLRPLNTLLDAVILLRRYKVDGLPVVDENEKLRGIFTKANLFDALMAQVSLGEPIATHYTNHVLTLNMNLNYSEVVYIVERSPMGMAVVINDDGKVIGLFTKVDMVMGALSKEKISNAKLRAIYDGVQNSLVVVNREGLIECVNRYTELTIGCQSEKIFGKKIDEVFPEFNAGKYLMPDFIGSGFQGKVELKGADMLLNINPIKTENEIAGLVISFQNICEVEKYASELRSVKIMNQTLNTVLEIAYDGIVVVDGEGQITMINGKFAKFMGVDKDKILHSPVDEVLENTRLHVVAKTGLPEINQIQVIKGIPYIVSRLPIVEDGKVVGAVGMLTFSHTEELRQLADKITDIEKNLTSLRSQLFLERQSNKNYVSVHDIITNNPEMIQLKGQISKVAQGDSTVLILGESGTGKELVARAIHFGSRRKNKPFIKINCAAIPETLLEAEFFGYAPGAFTGAAKNGKPGYFQLADGGTIFLDEIGDMPLSLQGKLLRVIEDMRFEQVGGASTIQVDVRIVAATNQNLEEKSKLGSFRPDLFYRLNVVCFEQPPLRHRKEDIMPLAYHFIQKYNHKFPGIKEISEQAMFYMQLYSWPGNIRELENAIERAMNFAEGCKVEGEHLPSQVFPNITVPAEVAESKTYLTQEAEYYEIKHRNEREVFAAALKASGGSKAKAARMLGISRSWLYKKIDQLGIR